MTARELIASQIRCMCDAIGLEEVFNVLVEVQSDRKALAVAPIVAPVAVAPAPPAPSVNGNGGGKTRRGMLAAFLRYVDTYPIGTELNRDHAFRWIRTEYSERNPSGVIKQAIDAGYIKVVPIKDSDEDGVKLTKDGRKRARDPRKVARTH